LKVSLSGLIVGLVSIGIGCALLAATWWSYVDYDRMKVYDWQATAEITKKHSRTMTDGKVQYYLDYSFAPAAGKKIEASNVVSKERWDAFQVKDTFKIRYNQANPSRHIPLYESGSSLPFAFFMLMLGAVFLIFGCSRLFYSFQKTKTPPKSNSKIRVKS
jgi:uncharacterized protein (TIGR02588 family)